MNSRSSLHRICPRVDALQGLGGHHEDLEHQMSLDGVEALQLGPAVGQELELAVEVVAEVELVEGRADQMRNLTRFV